jgi:hypothetical protein
VYVYVYKKTKREKLGVCAHFCPFCRGVRAFNVSSIGTVTTVNGIPVSSTTRLHDEIACRACGVVMGVPLDLVRPIPALPQGAEESLEMLAEVAEQTSPWSFGQLMSRLDLEARLVDGRVTAEERKWLVSEAFEATEYSAGLGLPGNAPVEGNKQFGLVFLILLFIFSAFASVIVWSVVVGGAGRAGWAWVIGLAALASVLLPIIIARGVREHREVKRKLVREPLGRALRAVGATETEVRAEYAVRKAMKSKLTKRVKEEAVVWAALGEQR